MPLAFRQEEFLVDSNFVLKDTYKRTGVVLLIYCLIGERLGKHAETSLLVYFHMEKIYITF